MGACPGALPGTYASKTVLLRNSARTLLPPSILVIIFFILGQWLYVPIFEFLEPRVGDIHFTIVEHSHLLRTSLLLSIFLALVPMAIVLNWRLAHIASPAKKIFSALIILCFVGLGVIMRRAMVSTYFTRVVAPSLSHRGQSDFNYPIDPVNFIYYMFAGLLTGFLAGFFLFRQTKYMHAT